MKTITELCKGMPAKTLEAGEILLKEGLKGGELYLLLEGEVEVVHKGETVARVSEPGSVFGEVAILLDRPHMATVKAVKKSTFFMAERSKEFLLKNPEIHLHVSQILASRLTSVTGFLVETKKSSAEVELRMVQTIEDLIYTGKLPKDFLKGNK